MITSTRQANYQQDNSVTEEVTNEEKSEEQLLQKTIMSKLIEPKYSIIYQQHLTARNVYYVDHFSEDGRNDTIMIKIILPKENISTINVKIDEDDTTLTLESEKYYLSLTLPHKVYKDKYTAQWHRY